MIIPMKKNIFGLFVWVSTLLATACGGGMPHYMTIEGPMLGTRMRIVADITSVSRSEVYSAAMELDREMKASMSIFDRSSLLSRVNRNETDSLDGHICFNFRLADSIGRLSDGLYDVTVKPLVEAWGFAGKHGLEHPNVDSLLQFVGRDKVRIVGGRLVKDDPRVQLDFNSVAKGYAVDRLAALVEGFGGRNYIVDIGGEIFCRGVNSRGEGWRIGVETPFDGNMSDGEYLQKRVQMTSGGMATSGNYRRFYLSAEGRKVAHTINPRTGYSALSRLLSVTVVAPTCAEADALGTMFLAMGADKAIQKAESLPGVKVYFILSSEDGGYEEYVSEEMKKLIMQ